MKRLAFLAISLLIFGGVLTVPVYKVCARPTTGDPSVPAIGKVVSATVQTTRDNDVVFTTPTKGSFLLTQVCATRAAGQTSPINLNSDAFGTVAVLPSTPSCVSFSPGYALPQGQALRCDFFCGAPPCVQSTADSIVCSISGIVEF